MSVQGDSAGPGAGGYVGRAAPADAEPWMDTGQGIPGPQAELARPDLLVSGKSRLSRLEKLQIAFIRKSFDPGRLDQSLRWGQRYVGSTWIHYFTRHLRHVYGTERLPELGP